MEKMMKYKGIDVLAIYQVTREIENKEVPSWVALLSNNGKLKIINEGNAFLGVLETPDGEMVARDGDYLVATERFEFYVVSGDLVEMSLNKRKCSLEFLK